MAAVQLVKNGLSVGQALELGIVNKSFDDFERQLVSDIIASRLPGSLTASDIFDA